MNNNTAKSKNSISSTKKQSKLSKIMRAPIRVLIKIRDFYILSMTECSAHFDYGTVMGCPAAQVPTTLPKSFSVSSSTSTKSTSDDYRELLKAASTRTTLANKLDLDFASRKSPSPGPTAAALPKSRSVGIARIDEDKPLEFDDEDGMAGGDVFPRSRSYAVHRRKFGF